SPVSLCYARSLAHLPPHSSPTRRSSDLYFSERGQSRLYRIERLRKNHPDENHRRDHSAGFRPGGGRADRKNGILRPGNRRGKARSEEHTSELQSRFDLVCRLLLEKKKVN